MFQNFSPNMLKTFEKCQKMFEFKYIKNLSMPVNDEIFETGKNIHALASYYLRKQNIDKMEKALSEQEKILWNYLKQTKYFSYNVIATEYNLSVKIGSYFFGGRLDALVKNEDRYYILDYKTGSAPKNPEQDFQTIIYMLCVRAFFKTDKISFIYIDLKNKEEVKIDLSKELINTYEKKLIDSAEKISKYDGASKLKKECNCEYKIICY